MVPFLTQPIEQQLTALRAYAQAQGWALTSDQVYRDAGWSGARLDRPALDRLRDAIGRAHVDTLLIASPDRLARRYAYQVWLLEEFARAGGAVIFLDRPPTDDPQGTVNLSAFNGNDGSKVGNTSCLRALISRQAPCLGR